MVKANIKYSYEELQKMVYLLNAKLRRALNGEKEDENADKETGDNIICSNCNLLTKEKNILEAKVQSLLDTIHKKDLEIAKLKEMLGLSDKADVMVSDEKKSKKKKHKKKEKGEKEEKEGKDGKKKKEDKDKKKDGKKNKFKDKKGNKDSSESSSDEESSSSSENDKDNSLFKEKEKKVNTLYNKVKDKLSKIQEENDRINIIQNEEEELRKIQLKIDSFNKAIHNYIKDKDKNKCFLKMDEMIKQSILMVKNVDYKKGFDEYKENMTKIFDENIKNMKTQKDLSNAFNIYFFYDFISITR